MASHQKLIDCCRCNAVVAPFARAAPAQPNDWQTISMERQTNRSNVNINKWRHNIKADQEIRSHVFQLKINDFRVLGEIFPFSFLLLPPGPAGRRIRQEIAQPAAGNSSSSLRIITARKIDFSLFFFTTYLSELSMAEMFFFFSQE